MKDFDRQYDKIKNRTSAREVQIEAVKVVYDFLLCLVLYPGC